MIMEIMTNVEASFIGTLCMCTSSSSLSSTTTTNAWSVDVSSNCIQEGTFCCITSPTKGLRDCMSVACMSPMLSNLCPIRAPVTRPPSEKSPARSTQGRTDRGRPNPRPTGRASSAPERRASRGLSDDIIVPSVALFVGLHRRVGVIR